MRRPWPTGGRSRQKNVEQALEILSFGFHVTKKKLFEILEIKLPDRK